MRGRKAETKSEDWKHCLDPDLDTKIGGCTVVIQSGQESDDGRALAFYKRGNGYSGRAQYERAIQDYDEAIRLKADFPEAFNSRGNAYSARGQFDRATQDYDQAIRVIPRRTGA